jgi:hypothetical protein
MICSVIKAKYKKCQAKPTLMSNRAVETIEINDINITHTPANKQSWVKEHHSLTFMHIA